MFWSLAFLKILPFLRQYGWFCPSRSMHFLCFLQGKYGQDSHWRCARWPRGYARMPDGQPSPQQEESCRVTEDGAVIADTKWRRPRFNTVGELHFASLSACLIFGSRSDTFCTVNAQIFLVKCEKGKTCKKGARFDANIDDNYRDCNS